MTNDPRIVMRPVAGLRPYDRNPRTHTPEQIAKVARSIQEYGWTNPILVDRDGTIVAGHARLEAAKSLGLAEVPTICLDHLTPAQARAYVIAGNQLALDAAWDEEILRVELAALQGLDFDLSLTGFDAGEIDRLLSDLDSTGAPPGMTDEDAVPEPCAEATTQPGDLLPLDADACPCRWSSPRVESVDRKTDAEADLREMRNGTRSRRDVIASYVQDPDAVDTEIALDIENRRRVGIVSDGDPAEVSFSGAVQPNPSHVVDRNSRSAENSRREIP